MADFVVTCGDATILCSGTVLTFESRPVVVAFGPEGDRTTLHFAFEKDATNPKSFFRSKVLDAKSILLTLVNFDSPFGGGTVRPYKFGEGPGGIVYVHFRAYTSKDGNHMLHFSIMQTPEVISYQ